MEYPYRITQRKNQHYWSMLFCLVFVALGLFLLMNQAPGFKVFTIAAGIANILFFGGGAFLIFKQMRKSDPSLMIDTIGIHDHSSALLKRVIPWEDVTGIRSESTLGVKYLLVDVHNPEDYIQKSGGGMVRSMLSSDRDKFGTPVYISTNHLDVEHEELMKLIQREFEQYRALPEDLRLELKEPLPRALRVGDIS